MIRSGSTPRLHCTGRAARLKLSLAFAMASALASCGMPLATMHGPAPVPLHSGVTAVGLGPVFFDEAGASLDPLGFALLFAPVASIRAPVTERLDIALGAGIFHGLSAEARYNMVGEPLLVTTGLGISTRSILGLAHFENAAAGPGVHPALLVGTERVYVGGRLLTFPTASPPRSWPVLLVGASVGRDVRLAPELGAVRHPDNRRTLWFGGLTLQRTRDRHH